MRNFWTTLALVLFCLVGVLVAPSQAQLQIDLGSDDQVFRILRNSGYTDAKVTKRSLTIIRTEACKGGKKYQIKVSILGRITSVSEIGTCRSRVQEAAFSERELRQLLEQNRYTSIETRKARRGFRAIACRNGRRFDLAFNRRGKIVDRKDLGYCQRRRLSNDQIITSLENAGYRRVDIVQSNPTNYLVEACRNDRRYQLRLDNSAEIQTRRTIGECGRRFSAERIADLLKERGYSKIEITRRNSTPYRATACRNNDKYAVTIGRRGRILDEQRTGSCRQRFDARTLSSLMQRRGYDRIKIVRTNRAPYIAEGCVGDALQEIQVGQFGKVLREYRIGKCARPVTRKQLQDNIQKTGHLVIGLKKVGENWQSRECRQDNQVVVSYDPYGEQTNIRANGKCRSETVLDVLRTLESRGARRVEAFVEGCFDGGKYRWSFDRLGNRTGRKRVGSC
jgi:hypothetical protein